MTIPDGQTAVTITASMIADSVQLSIAAQVTMQPAAGYLAATDAEGSYESAQVTFFGNPKVGFVSTMDTVYEGNPLALWMTSSKYSAATPLLVNYSIGGTAVNGYDYVDSGANLDELSVRDGPLSGTVDLDAEKYYLGPSVGHGIVTRFSAPAHKNRFLDPRGVLSWKACLGVLMMVMPVEPHVCKAATRWSHADLRSVLLAADRPHLGL